MKIVIFCFTSFTYGSREGTNVFS